MIYVYVSIPHSEYIDYMSQIYTNGKRRKKRSNINISQLMNDKENVVSTDHDSLFSLAKKGNPCMYANINEIGEYNAN